MIDSCFLQGILSESHGTDSTDHVFTLVEGIIDPNKNGANSGSSEDLVGDEEGEKSVASAEDQLHKEMTVYEVYDALDVS